MGRDWCGSSEQFWQLWRLKVGVSCYGEERAPLASTVQELFDPAAAQMPCISVLTDPKSHGINLLPNKRFLMDFTCFCITNGLMN